MVVMGPAGSMAAVDHSQLVRGPFKNALEVTKACIACHDRQAADFIKTPHWTWKGPPRLVKGMERSAQELGKINLVNNFAISVQGGPNYANIEACAKCHAGYGLTGSGFDYSDRTRIDCLVCHAREAAYKKVSAGMPDAKAIVHGYLDLTRAAQGVGAPTRNNCGTCHFFSGGEDGSKNGDLSSSLLKTDKANDVHMGTRQSGGQDMACQRCHRTSRHRIAGASTFLATYDGRVACEDCHAGAKDPHRDSPDRAILNRHLASVACQTCHIPQFAREQATKMSWDWSSAGKEIEPEEQFDKDTFDKGKGSFVWGKNVVPTYAWFNGTVRRYLKGEKITGTAEPVALSRPAGDITDAAAKIYPFKALAGNQPMDSVYRYLLVPQTHGEFYDNHDWERALREGAKGTGLPYSGKFEFVRTVSFGNINHEVAPREKALRCGECHEGGRRLDWKALGYPGDPLKTGGRSGRSGRSK
ncbi:tetrathionate reductase family octaheme c-type cytochrome [Geomonas sp. Red51]|nr:tetrathionate reductase family octaheme c-type cytochrome [Geomonas azotofigens]